MFLGVGGYGEPGSPSAHYMVVEEGCTVCHMAEKNHTLEPSTAACQSCHAELDTVDRNGVQTEIEELFLELEQLLVDKGVLATAEHEPYHPGETDVHPNPGTYSEELAGAAWNYMIVFEDNSFGIHNPSWIKAILEKGIELMQ